jgi:hypothetical protein
VRCQIGSGTQRICSMLLLTSSLVTTNKVEGGSVGVWVAW